MNQLTSEQLKWCEKHLPKEKWKVNSQGLVDVEGNALLHNQTFQKLPVAFGRVSGHFDLEGCEQLLTLEGSPREVGEYFDCQGCISLKSLEGAPQRVSGGLYCNGCTGLQSLKGAPESVGKSFWCEGCTSLPEWVYGLAKELDDGKITWEELLQTHDKFLEKPQLVQAKNLGLF